jgi:hypothetical protein
MSHRKYGMATIVARSSTGNWFGNRTILESQSATAMIVAPITTDPMRWCDGFAKPAILAIDGA